MRNVPAAGGTLSAFPGSYCGSVQRRPMMGDRENPEKVPAGTPGAGENICRRCRGSGRVEDEKCPDCGGTGKVTTGIGGG
jgi:hypothetical protein